MSHTLPVVYLARHGETTWSLSGQHTGLSDIPLTDRGEHNARQLGERLKGLTFAKIFTSPLQRAMRTCELAGFGPSAQPLPELVEWNYGNYEGLRTAEIQSQHPGWNVFRDGCPGGESPAASRPASRPCDPPGPINSRRRPATPSGHFLRVLTARWLGLAPEAGKHYLLSTASVSALGYEHELTEPVIRLWNDVRHVDME